MNLQPALENETVLLQPLKASDFEQLFEVASDPRIWEQHPNPDRYKREVFKTFFEGALASGGAFLVMHKPTGEVAGSTRFYDYNPEESSIFIGYTFYGTKFWGSWINPQIKRLMLDYIFQFVDKVNFHVGQKNIRSQKALERLGAEKIAEEEVAYHGETPQINFLYQISK